jgi:uncharacterized protein
MQERIDLVHARLVLADTQTEALSARTGLACPPGCGACCLSPEIETSVADLLPLAAELVRAGRAAGVLAEIERRSAGGERRCVLYEPDASDERRGRCAAYAHRPLVCRLFGFAARRDREGSPALVGCRTMRAAEPEAVARAEAHVREGGAVAFFADHAHALAAELPAEGAVQRPINEALGDALQRALLAERFGRLEREPAPDAALAGPAAVAEPPDDPEPRPQPTRPRRAA